MTLFILKIWDINCACPQEQNTPTSLDEKESYIKRCENAAKTCIPDHSQIR
jgi:hypothetical protein